MAALFTSIAALIYALGSLFTKRSMNAGADSRRVVAVTNIAMALWALPLFFISRSSFDWGSWAITIVAGVALFAGRIFSIKALEVGDLSLVGTLLGIKTLLVGFFAFITGQVEMTLQLFIAIIFASIAVILLQQNPGRSSGQGPQSALVYAFAASVLFAVTDILVAEAGASLGIGWLSPTLFITLALMIPLLGKPPPEPPAAKKSLYLGAAIMGFQTSFVILLIAVTGNAVLINIVYSTRALWTVIVDRYAGRGEAITTHFSTRMAGAFLMVIAVCIVLVEQW